MLSKELWRSGYIYHKNLCNRDIKLIFIKKQFINSILFQLSCFNCNYIFLLFYDHDSLLYNVNNILVEKYLQIFDGRWLIFERISIYHFCTDINISRKTWFSFKRDRTYVHVLVKKIFSLKYSRGDQQYLCRSQIEFYIRILK